jgi:hypothetical protein
MSTTRRFPPFRTALGGAALTALAAVATLAPAPARAEDNMLRGPHPFLKDNELSAHVQLVAGIGNTPGGTKIAAEYGYRFMNPVWLNLQVNFQNATCRSESVSATCNQPTGSVFETLAGIKLKWATPIPLVPYVKGGIGLAYAFPDGASNTMGIAGRGGAGASWFFFDWLGIGAEFGYSVGSMSMKTPGGGVMTNNSAYSELDFGGGVEFQF